jgi:hypothetical protein
MFKHFQLDYIKLISVALYVYLYYEFLVDWFHTRQHTLHRGVAVTQISGGKMQVLEVPLPGDNREGETDG